MQAATESFQGWQLSAAPVGQEHGRTIPLADVKLCMASAKRTLSPVENGDWATYVETRVWRLRRGSEQKGHCNGKEHDLRLV